MWDVVKDSSLAPLLEEKNSFFQCLYLVEKWAKNWTILILRWQHGLPTQPRKPPESSPKDLRWQFSQKTGEMKKKRGQAKQAFINHLLAKPPLTPSQWEDVFSMFSPPPDKLGYKPRLSSWIISCYRWSSRGDLQYNLHLISGIVFSNTVYREQRSLYSHGLACCTHIPSSVHMSGEVLSSCQKNFSLVWLLKVNFLSSPKPPIIVLDTRGHVFWAAKFNKQQAQEGKKSPEQQNPLFLKTAKLRTNFSYEKYGYCGCKEMRLYHFIRLQGEVRWNCRVNDHTDVHHCP